MGKWKIVKELMRIDRECDIDKELEERLKPIAERMKSSKLDIKLAKDFIKEYEITKNGSVLLVIPEKCEYCGTNLTINLSTSPSMKCNKLKAIYTCINCKKEQLIEFCLP